MGTKIAKVLVLIGGLNWGLIGAFNWNLVNKIFGSISWLERLVYVLVGLSAILLIVKCKCKACKGHGCCGGSCGSEKKEEKAGSCKGGNCSGK